MRWPWQRRRQRRAWPNVGGALVTVPPGVDRCNAQHLLGVSCQHWHVVDYRQSFDTYDGYWMQHWCERHNWRGPLPDDATYREGEQDG